MTIFAPRAFAILAALGRDRTSLKTRAVWGTVWTVGAYGADNVIRLASNFILAQLFATEVFGLLALAFLVQMGLGMFSDLGLGLSIVRHRNAADRAFLNTAWTIQAVRGVVIWIGACILTWPMAAAYGEPALMAVVPVAGLTAVIQGLQSTRVYTASRELSLGRVTALKVGESTLRFVITIAWAIIDPSVWAIVGGGLISAAVHTALTHVILPGLPDRPAWDRTAARDLLGFAQWVFVSSALTFFALQSDKLLLGKVAGLSVLGVYAVATPFARLPQEIAFMLGASVLFPALAAGERESRDRLRTMLERARAVILPGGLAATLGVAIVAPWFFRLYRPDYHDAIWIAPMLAAGLWFSVLQASSDRALLTVGTARPLALANAVALAVTLVGCSLGLGWAGMPGFLAGVGLGCAAGYLVVARALGRAGLPVLRRDARYTAALAAGLALAFAPQALGERLFPHRVTTLLAVEMGALVLLLSGVFALRRAFQALESEPERPPGPAVHPPVERTPRVLPRPEIVRRRVRRGHNEPLRA